MVRLRNLSSANRTQICSFRYGEYERKSTVQGQSNVWGRRYISQFTFTFKKRYNYSISPPPPPSTHPPASKISFGICTSGPASLCDCHSVPGVFSFFLHSSDPLVARHSIFTPLQYYYSVKYPYFNSCID